MHNHPVKLDAINATAEGAAGRCPTNIALLAKGGWM